MDTFVRDILNKIEELAPFGLTMDFDNTGLLVGDSNTLVTCAMVALDCTMEVIDQAKAAGAQLIVTHHPVIFHPLKRVTAGSVVYRLVQEGISVISAHTNLDIAAGGVNDCLARRLGLQQVEGLSSTHRKPFFKIAVFVPHSHVKAVYQAMVQAGAGTLGNYSGCAFFNQGTGTFLPQAGAHPFLGKVGTVEKTDEVKIEMICAPKAVDSVVAAMKQAHPYEMPAYDIWEDKAVEQKEYLGRVGQLSRPMAPEEFARFVKEALGSAVTFTAGKVPVQRVAVCGGSGGSQLRDAAAAGAQALVTGDVKHDVFIEADHLGLTLVDAGHFGTEDVVIDPLAANLAEAFPQVQFLAGHHRVMQTI